MQLDFVVLRMNPPKKNEKFHEKRAVLVYSDRVSFKYMTILKGKWKVEELSCQRISMIPTDMTFVFKRIQFRKFK